ncbi:MAG: COX15/CtaA family protein [Stackebrandtia sp.]
MSPKWARRLSLLNVGVNVLIVVTGGAVRLTDSGLGCPSWPNCQPGSFHATAEMGMHGAIEWGNRLFGAVVGLVAIAAFVAAVMRRPRRASLVWLTGTVAVGVAAQAVIGAFTVGADLTPWLVSVHFLVSAGILVAAYAAWVRSGEPDGRVRALTPRPVRALVWLIAAVAVATLAIGTMVTGAGPHAGDPDSPRLGFDLDTVTQFHADAVFLLVGLSIALVFTLRAVDAPKRLRNAALLLVGMEFAQGAIGLTQYFTGLPVLLVGAHVFGAVLLWVAVLRLLFATRTRLPDTRPPRQRDVLTFEDDEPDADDEREAAAEASRAGL